MTQGINMNTIETNHNENNINVMMNNVNNSININSMNTKVYVKPSQIPNGGNGLYAKQFLSKHEVICTYGGKLIDEAEAKYCDPMYIASFEPGKGYKLSGDNEDGDLGHYANSIHPLYPSSFIQQNAKFRFQSKKYDMKQLRGRFNVIATKDIQPHEEIFVNYGPGYWQTMERWMREPQLEKSIAVQHRDLRAKRRLELKDQLVLSKKSSSTTLSSTHSTTLSSVNSMSMTSITSQTNNQINVVINQQTLQKTTTNKQTNKQHKKQRIQT